MTALVIASTGWDGLLTVIGIMITLAIGVLLPHLGSYRPAKDAVKRVIAAVIVASALGTIGAAVVHADDDDEFVMMNRCPNLTPSDLEWWVRGCMFLPRRKRAVRRRAGRTS